jgi:hypothetical protein
MRWKHDNTEGPYPTLFCPLLYYYIVAGLLAKDSTIEKEKEKQEQVTREVGA